MTEPVESPFLEDDADDPMDYPVAAAYYHVIARVKADPTVNAFVGGRVTADDFPDRAKFPLVLVQQMGADTGAPGNGASPWRNVPISVRIVSDKKLSRNTAALAALEEALGDTDGANKYGVVLDCLREEGNPRVVREGGQTLYYYGSIYTVSVQEPAS